MSSLYDPTRERDACGIGFVADAQRARRPGDRRPRARGAPPRAPPRAPSPPTGAPATARGAPAADPARARPRALVRAGDGVPPRRRGAGRRSRRPAGRGHRAARLARRARRAGRARRGGARDRAADRAARPSAPARAEPTRRPSAAPTAPAGARSGPRGAYVASLSFRTVTYKALCAADQLGAFYPDLRDPALAVPFAVFHQRFSTNTTPSWERAQPFRLLCHNGEINAIQGNVNWMRAREGGSGCRTTRCSRRCSTRPGSDSAMLDNALELLVRGGRDVRHAAAMLVPAGLAGEPRARRGRARLLPLPRLPGRAVGRAAGLVFTDGRVVGAALDRNGLRPLRYAVLRRRPRRLLVRGRRGRLRRRAGACGAASSARARCSSSTRERGLEDERAIKRRLAAAAARTAAGSRTAPRARLEPATPAAGRRTTTHARGRSLPATPARS